MKNILMITRPILPPWNEGSKNMAYQIVKRDKRHHFHLLTSRSVDRFQVIDTISLHSIYSDSGLSICQKWRLFWFLVQPRPNISIYHSLFVPTLITSRILSYIARLYNKKYIQTVPSIYNNEISSKDASKLFFGDKVITLSDWTANQLRTWGVKNVIRINAGVDLLRFRQITAKDVLRKKIGLPEKIPIALFSGELSRLGSVEIILSAIPQVIRDNPSVCFVFACPIRVDEDIEVEQRAKETTREMNLHKSVYFIGEVDDFPALLNACDIFLFPVAHMIGKIDTPLTLLEAMAVGLPVIVTDIAPLNEVFHDEIGIAVPIGSTVAFSQAILELTENVMLRTEMGKRAREVIRNYYDVNQMVKSYEELYDRVD